MEAHDVFAEWMAHAGKKLYDFRRARNEKMVTVAKNIGISQATLSKIENGKYAALNFTLLSRLVYYYNSTLTELFQDCR